MSFASGEQEVVTHLAVAISKSMVSTAPMVRYDREDDSIAIDVPAIVRAVRTIEAAIASKEGKS